VRDRTECGADAGRCPSRLLLLALCVLTGQTVQAAEAETDVMEAGKMQLEFKAAWMRDAATDSRERSTPFLARIGLNDTMELRLGTEGRVRSTTAGQSTQGWADVNIGLRIHTHSHDSGSPESAWQLEVGLPTGSSTFKAPSASYAVKYAVEWAFSETASIAIMPGLTRQRNASNRWYNAPYFAVTAGKNWTPDLRMVVELVGEQFASPANGGNIAAFKLGGVSALTEHLELETVYTRGLNSHSPRHGLELSLNVKF
jgi:Putative MetA-pathway of phenol degradation